MQRIMLKSKIHQATITDSDLHYVGSITIDADLLEAADTLPDEMVAVLVVDNGARFETYTIPGERGSRQIKVNGAAARLVHQGDTIIVISYAGYGESELLEYKPKVVHVDADNQILAVDHLVSSARRLEHSVLRHLWVIDEQTGPRARAHRERSDGGMTLVGFARKAGRTSIRISSAWPRFDGRRAARGQSCRAGFFGR